jgi:hypothetical protein
VSLFCFYNSIFIFFTSISRGPKGLYGAGGDPGEVAEGAGRGAEGPGVDRGEAPVLFVFPVFFVEVSKKKKEKKQKAPKEIYLSFPLSVTHRITSFPSAEIDFVTSLGRSCFFYYLKRVAR